MDRLTLFAPALAVLSLLVGAMVVYAFRRPPIFGFKHNRLFGPFLAGYAAWILGPIERRLLGRVSPSAITTVSLLVCCGAGVAIGLGSLFAGAWLYAAAGALDILDGRLARLGARETVVGALYDSVSDRWGELAVFGGYAWYAHDSGWLLAVMAALGGSMMVSYTRARAEALGATASGGIMQRAERIVLVTIGTLTAAWFAVDPAESGTAATIVGVTMAICGAATIATAIHRWIAAAHSLRAGASAQSAGTTTMATTTQDSSPRIASTPNDASARLAAGISDA